MSKKKILVVDDDPAARVILEIYLQDGGFEISFAEDGVSCMTIARRERPDLILLDLGLPAGDGITVLRRMKQLNDLSSIPVIVVSARDAGEWQDVACQAQAVGFLEKPVERDELLAAVRDCLAAEASDGTQT